MTVSVELRADAEPSIQWRHIDGPMLHGRNCQIHWLTLWERLRCALGLEDAWTLERKHWPVFVTRYERALDTKIAYGKA